MSDNVNEISNLINNLISRQISGLRDKINLLLNETKVSPEDLNVFNQHIQTNGVSIDTDCEKYLREFTIDSFKCNSQSEILKMFRKFMSNFADFSSFFIIKQGKAVCFDVFPETAPVKKGYTFDAVIIDKYQETLDRTPLSKHLSQLSSPHSDIYVFPIYLKYKVAGYIICKLKQDSFTDIVMTAVSILSRELTLLPAKPKQSEAPAPQEQKPVRQEPQTGEIPSTPSASFNWDESAADRAKRYAKLLVSEIILYNEKLVKKGRAEGGLKSLLDADIERSFSAFRERFSDPSEVPDQIFEQALIMYLAEGKATLL